jgi:WD40 repeat protein
LRGHEAQPRWLAFNPAGDLLASTAWDGTVRLWDPWAGKLRVISPGCDWMPRFSHEGRLGLGRDGWGFALWEVASGREFRMLYAHEGPWVAPHTVDVSPEGRLLASTGGDRVCLWDLDSATLVASLETGPCVSGLFQGDGKALVVSDSSGVRRWPIDVGTRSGRLHVQAASAQSISTDRGPQWLSVCRATGAIAIADPARQRTVVMNPNHPETQLALGPHPGVNRSAISADGRWVATCTWHDDFSGTKVWDARTGQHCKDLGVGDAIAAFSPDGRWLVVGSEPEYRAWEIGSWRPGWKLDRENGSFPGPRAFTAEGHTLAIAPTRRLVRLVESSTGRTLADLTAPDPLPITCLCFSPTDRYLVVATASHVIHVWDLRLVRQQLAEMGLDWETSP